MMHRAMLDRPGGGNHATSALRMQVLLSGSHLYDGIIHDSPALMPVFMLHPPEDTIVDGVG